jgi:2-phospho-L-lactate transferase/gluconeogenesis factor (CofD/UPF0052 family)
MTEFEQFPTVDVMTIGGGGGTTETMTRLLALGGPQRYGAATTMTDSGGGSGRQRLVLECGAAFGLRPHDPQNGALGDLRRVMAAVSRFGSTERDTPGWLFDKKFGEYADLADVKERLLDFQFAALTDRRRSFDGDRLSRIIELTLDEAEYTHELVGIQGLAPGGIMLSALRREQGLAAAAQELGELLEAQAPVQPLTLPAGHLGMRDGLVVFEREKVIDEYTVTGDPRKVQIWTNPVLPINPVARHMTANSQAVIFPPGSMLTSTRAAAAVEGVGGAVREAQDKGAAFIIMVNFAQDRATPGMDAGDHIEMIENQIGVACDYAFVNTAPLPEGLTPVASTGKRLDELGECAIGANLFASVDRDRRDANDLVADRSTIVTNIEPVAALLNELVMASV